MTRPATLEQPTVSTTALFLRWLMLVFMALDLASAPMHAHAHDFGPDQYLGHSHGDGRRHQDLVEVSMHTGLVDHAGHAAHALGHHASAAIRSPENSPSVSPRIEVIVASVAELLAQEPTAAAREVVWPAAADYLPTPSNVPLRPEGRAPPPLHS